jgi:hypothetical protein
MKRIIVVTFVFLLIALQGVARPSDEEQNAKEKDGQPDILDMLFLNLPDVFGSPLYTFRHSILGLSGGTTPNDRLNIEDPFSDTEKGEQPDLKPLITDFGPRDGSGPSLIVIGGHAVRGSLRFDPQMKMLTGQKIYKPGEYYMPAVLDYNLKLDSIRFPEFYKEMQTSVFLSVEF